MDELEKELKVCFLDEAAQLIEEAEQCFLSLESNREDITIIEKIFRLAHNLKGSSRAVGFSQMAEFTHVFESLLLKLKNKEMTVETPIVSLLLRCNDHLRNWISELKNNLEASIDSIALIAELEDAIAGKLVQAETSETAPASSEVAAAEAGPAVPPALPDIAQFSMDKASAAAGLDMPSPPSVAAEPSPTTGYPPATAFDENPQTMVVAKPEPKPVAPPPKTSAPAQVEDETVRVSLRRLEVLVNFVGELVILQTVLNQQRHLIQSPLITRTIGQLAKITKDIQDLSMSLRMVPLRQTFQKMQRIVRDTSKLLGKDINFVLKGEHTEVDKTVVEQLGDPLVHLVRNAVDHGIEDAEARAAAGKPKQGSISLEAFHRGDKIIIEVRDDGKGLDPEKLKAKALEKGIIRPDQVLSDDEAKRLIFAAGFSTKAEVTEVSGRGVGMDVVKTNIEKNLHGEIELTSEVGKGSTIRVVLPLTLAIIDGMIVKAADERYVVPLNHVHESLQPSAEDVHIVSGLGEVLSIRGEQLPLFRLSGMLGRGAKARPATDSIAIVVRTGEKPFSILVDDIVGQQQIVIKQLGSEVMRNMKGVSGGAILGDGRAALILDLVELANRGKTAAARA